MALDSYGFTGAEESPFRLFKGGPVNSLVPCSSLGDAPSYWTSLSPPGLSKAVDQLTTIMQPYLYDRLVFCLEQCFPAFLLPRHTFHKVILLTRRTDA